MSSVGARGAGAGVSRKCGHESRLLSVRLIPEVFSPCFVARYHQSAAKSCIP